MTTRHGPGGSEAAESLLSALVGDRLVAVTFVLDSYLQLQFDDATMNVEVWPEVQTVDGRWGADRLGYADALRRLCGQQVVATSEQPGDGLRITLSSGEVHINPGKDDVVVEIALLMLDGGRWTCWLPGEEPFEHLA